MSVPELRDQMGCDLPNDWKLGGQAAGREHLTTGEARELFADAD